jgi:hypothetical protein
MPRYVACANPVVRQNPPGLKDTDHSAGSLQTRTMIEILRWLGTLIRAAIRERSDLAPENLPIRQQLAVLQITANPPENRVRRAPISPDGAYLEYRRLEGIHVRRIDAGETR